MLFQIERQSLQDRDEWEPVGDAEGSDDRAACEAIEKLGDTVGIYRVRPAGREDPWMFAYLDAEGRCERREVI